MKRRSIATASLVTITLGALAVIPVASYWRPTMASPVPPSQICVHIRNTFVFENVGIRVNGVYQGKVGPQGRVEHWMQRNSVVNIVPDISPGTSFQAALEGVYEVWAPCGPGQICPAQIRGPLPF